MFPNYLHTNPHLSKEFHIAKKTRKTKMSRCIKSEVKGKL